MCCFLLQTMPLKLKLNILNPFKFRSKIPKKFVDIEGKGKLYL